jgi:uncharacterized protein
MVAYLDRTDTFSYRCGACGRCCRDKLVTLSPYDVIRMARAAGIATGGVVRRFTIRRGSILKFRPDGACVALEGARCTLHRGRPLACRLYPLGLERDGSDERFIRLQPAAGSIGVYGESSSVGGFLSEQGVESYFRAVDRYHALLPLLRERVAALADFERTEPREFWRRAFREATAESNFDPNPIIDAMFDPDALGCRRERDEDTVAAHVGALAEMASGEHDPHRLAAAAMMLAISLGCAPAEAVNSERGGR